MGGAVHAGNRFDWALEILRIQPADEVLEIGCGTGIAAAMVAERLASGRIVAIDRSAAMIAKAQSKCRSEKIRFEAGRLGSAALPARRFSKAFAFNVSSFWMPGAVTELGILRSRLRPDGAFYLFHQPPTSAKTEAIAGKSLPFLEAAGFRVEKVLYGRLPPALASCIIAKPAGKGAAQP